MTLKSARVGFGGRDCGRIWIGRDPREGGGGLRRGKNQRAAWSWKISKQRNRADQGAGAGLPTSVLAGEWWL